MPSLKEHPSGWTVSASGNLLHHTQTCIAFCGGGLWTFSSNSSHHVYLPALLSSPLRSTRTLALLSVSVLQYQCK